MTSLSPTPPPFVQDHPLWQLWRWTFDPVGYLESCAQRYGDSFVLRLGPAYPCAFISHPDAVADLFALSNAKKLDSGRGQMILKLVLGDYSSMLLDGEQHQRHRQMIMPSMHGERLKLYGDIICQITRDATQGWRTGSEVTMLPVLAEITLKVILKTVFGFQGTSSERELIQRIKEFVNLFTSPTLYLVAFFPILQRDWGTWSPKSRLDRMMQELDDLMFAEIRKRRANLDPNAIDILTMMLLARDENGERLSDQEVRDELLTLLFAGHDSSSSTFSWAFYWIYSNPAVRDRLIAEIDSLGASPDPMEIVQLPYLSAVGSESLRIQATVPSSSTRITTEPVSINGFEYPIHSVIVPAQHLTHQRPELYPEPRQFNPDRFLERRFSPSEYYPYGGGTRRCVGAVFASFQMKLIVSTILQDFSLDLAETRPIKTVRRGINMAPGSGVKMRVTAVRAPAKAAAATAQC
jgi:cytochrome P450